MDMNEKLKMMEIQWVIHIAIFAKVIVFQYKKV